MSVKGTAASVPTPLEELRESPFNRRRAWGDLEELAASFKELGVLQPLLARPVDDGKGRAGRLELVFGHRRYRAARMAGLESVPVNVREMTDEQVIEAQAIENLQRANVHPLDEAETYEQLLKIGRTVDQIADRVGKSKAYVYGRLKLLTLGKDIRKAFLEDTLSSTAAFQLARLPVSVQAEAWKELQRWRRADGEVTARSVQDVVERSFLLRLADAPFDRADASLVPKAGSCKDCPKRTGNQKELFADVKSPDLCTDTACFREKRAAHTKRQLAVLGEKGATILEGKTAQKALSYSAPYVKLDEPCWEDPKHRNYGALLKGAELPLVVAVDQAGDLVRLAPKDAAAKALRAAGLKGARATGSSMSADEKKRREAGKRKRLVTMALLEQLVARAEAATPKGFWKMLAEVLVPLLGHDAKVEILVRRGLGERAPSWKSNPEKPLLSAIGGMTEEMARGFVVEAAASNGAFAFGPWAGAELGRGLTRAAAFYKVDVAAIRTKALAAAKSAKNTKKDKRKVGMR